MKIAVVGVGYVGLSNALLLAQKNTVYALDILPEKIDLLNARKSPIKDAEIEEFLAAKALDFHATLDAKEALAGADFIIISTPTDYDSSKDFFDTSTVESSVALAHELAPTATVVIKSTVPVGFTGTLRQQYPKADIFLRRNSCGKERRFMIICIRRALLSAITEKVGKRLLVC